jgi:integrase
MYSSKNAAGNYFIVVQHRGQRGKVTASTKAEVEVLAAQMLLSFGGQLKPSGVTVRLLVAEWQEGDLAESFRADIDTLIPILPEAFMERTLTEVDPLVIKALYKDLAKGDPASGRRKLSPFRVARVHTILHAAFALAVQDYGLPSNPCFGKAPTVPKSPKKIPTVDKVIAVLTAVEGTDFELYLELSSLIGARRGEVVALQWADLNIGQSSILVGRSLSKTAKAGLTITGGKEGEAGHRVVALPQPFTERLVALELHQRQLAMASGLPRPVWIFSSDAGQHPWLPGYPTLRFTRLRASLVKKGIDLTSGTGITIKSLRHFMATQCLTAGVPLLVVSGRLGHRNMATTAKFYADFIAASDQGSADLMAGVLQRTS